MLVFGGLNFQRYCDSNVQILEMDQSICKRLIKDENEKRKKENNNNENAKEKIIVNSNAEYARGDTLPEITSPTIQHTLTSPIMPRGSVMRNYTPSGKNKAKNANEQNDERGFVSFLPVPNGHDGDEKRKSFRGKFDMKKIMALTRDLKNL
jgi:hypothetical protein